MMNDLVIENCAKAIADHMGWDWNNPTTLSGNNMEDEQEHFKDVSKLVMQCYLKQQRVDLQKYASTLRVIARNLSYNNENSEAIAKHKLHQIAIELDQYEKRT